MTTFKSTSQALSPSQEKRTGYVRQLSGITMMAVLVKPNFNYFETGPWNPDDSVQIFHRAVDITDNDQPVMTRNALNHRYTQYRAILFLAYLVDPDLAEWLSRGPTVMINLGTHV
ncbi:hypothetical protein F4775DRAFT_590209 [Biscogniauxia sp. FL1348]|nr:hypothetical protein F4775DRAFT_590209 [Biscogniauxia sp. FL1348]